jgi:membrane fusion protein (multidrug efflux system)
MLSQTYLAKQIIAAAFLAGLLALAACGKGPQKGGPFQAGPPEVAVTVMQPAPVVLTQELPGRTSPCLVAEVRPQVGGIIKKRNFIEGADVKEGDVLYEIDPEPYRAAYASAKAGLARAEANVTSIRSRVERYKELAPIDAVSRQDYDDASAQLQQTMADIEANKAAVETARINLAYTRVTAPISGRIGRSNVTVGALASVNQATAFATIHQLDPIFVDVTESSANWLQLRRKIAAGRVKNEGPGQTRVKLLLEDGTPYPLEGTLKFSEVAVDQTTGSFVLRIVFPNPQRILLPGMYVRAIVQEGVAEQAIVVPQQAVSRDPKGNAIALIVDDSGKVAPRIVTIDRALGNKWLVASGLAAGDRVIVEGLQKVRPGVPVKIVPSGAGQNTAPGGRAASSGGA